MLAGPVPAGYFMLAQQRLLACAPAPFAAHAHVPGSDLPTVWRAAWDSRTRALERLAQGDILAPGVSPGVSDDGGGEGGEEPPALILDPPCRLCDYGRLCGVGSVRA